MALVPTAAPYRGATVIDRLREAGAVRREQARVLTDLPAGHRRQINRLMDRGVVRRTPAGAYYLDRDALSDFRALQQRVVFSVVIVVAGLIAGIALTAA